MTDSTSQPPPSAEESKVLYTYLWKRYNLSDNIISDLDEHPYVTAPLKSCSK